MSDKQMDRLDALTRKMVKDLPKEKPSFNFSKNVMDEIYGIETAKEFKKNKPLISKTGWLIFVGIIVASTIFLFSSTSMSENNFLSKIDMSQFTNLFSLDISLGFSVSNVTLYGFVFFAIMISFQIGYIKNHYNSKYN